MVEFTARERLKLLLGGSSALMLAACGGSSESSLPAFADGGGSPPPVPPPPPPTPPPTGGTSGPVTGLLRDSFRNNFRVGAALSNQRVDAFDMSAQVAQDQFSSITPEWELKPDVISPNPGEFNFSEADRVVDWALENGMEVRGHALLWHEATPAHFLLGTPDEIRARLEDYITTVVRYFSGRVNVWDVVNETVSVDIYRGADGIGPDRRSDWFNAVGSADYIDWAFRAARAADPAAQLFLSEYGTETPLKREWMIEILRRLNARGVPIDGVGHQFHLYLDTNAQDALDAIDAVDNEFLGLINHATEIDVTFYDDPGSCWQTRTNCIADVGTTPPANMLADQALLLRNLFNGFAARSSVESVSFWGVRDSDSWLNDVPVVRSNYPLLFDRDGNPKPCFEAITDPNYVI